MENIITEKDYDLTQKHKLFDILYSVTPKNPSEIFVWVVTGFYLRHASNKRDFGYTVTSYPVSEFINFNTIKTLEGLGIENHIVGASKAEILESAKELLNREINVNLDRIKNLE